ncbi:MAG: ChrR family anti-sigma-E factor [Rhodospirillales bacterium]
MIVHHPDPEVLLDYAAGALAEGPSIAVATHLSLCALCRAEVARFEAMGGALVSDAADPEAAAAAPDALLEATLARLDEPAPRAPATAALDEATRRLVPSPLWPYLDAPPDELAWKRVGRGVREARVAVPGERRRVSLLRIRAGAAVPVHTHVGDELTVVLSGGFSDHAGHYGRGDFVALNEVHEHRPVADAGEDCLCLTVVDAPARLTGPFGRLLNPLIKR